MFLKRYVTPEKLEKLKTKYSVDVTCSTSSGDHHHPHLALERTLALSSLSRRCRKDGLVTAVHPVMDYFGNASEMRRQGFAHVHSVMPALAPSDEIRWAARRDLPACRHTPLECNCVEGSVGIFVQSVQYLGPKGLCKVLKQLTAHRAYSVVHRFNGLAGAFYGDEQVWHRVSGGRVHVVMDKGTCSWEHDACDWLDEPYHCIDEDVDLISNNVWNVGETYIYEHVLKPLTREPPSVPIREWRPALLSQAQTGLFAVPSMFAGTVQSALHLDVVTFKKSRIRFFGPILLFLADTEHEIVLSKDVVSALSTFMLGKPREASLYTTALRKANQMYSDIPNLPPSHLPLAVLFSVMLALEGSTEFELQVLTELCYNQRNMWGAHGDAVRFAPRFSVSGSTVAACVGSSAVTVGVSHFFPTTLAFGTTSNVVAANVYTTSALVVASHGVALTIPPVALAWGVFSTVATLCWAFDLRFRPSSHERTITTNTFANTEPGELGQVPNQTVTFAFAPKYSSIDEKRMKPVAEVREGASLTKLPPKVQAQTTDMSLIGMSVGGVIPTYYPNTRDAMMSSLSNRVTKVIPLAEEGIWDVVRRHFEGTREQIMYVHDTKSPFTLTGEKVKEWAVARYNVNRTEELVKVFLDKEATNFSLTAKERQVKPFIKKEKQVALEIRQGSIVGTEAKAPRPIMQHSDAVLVLVCPVLTRSYNRNKDAAVARWKEEGVLPGICPPGISGEAIGTWLLEVEEKLGHDCIVLDADGSTWDAHMQEQQMKAAGLLVANHLRVTPNRSKQLLLDMPRLKGKSALGVKVEAGVMLATGAPWTGTFNGKINAAMATYLMDTGAMSRTPLKDSGLGSHFFIMVSGDDLVVIVRRQYWNHMFASVSDPPSAWVAAGKRLGFSLKVNLGNLDSMEWCSRFFYPTLVDGKVLRLPGAKIGRALTRGGWMLDARDGSDLRSATIGLLQDNYHVPFLREFYQKQLDLLPQTNKKAPRNLEHTVHLEKRHDYGEETWTWMSLKYGLGKADLGEFVEQLSKVDSLPANLAFDVARLLERE